MKKVRKALQRRLHDFETRSVLLFAGLTLGLAASAALSQAVRPRLGESAHADRPTAISMRADTSPRKAIRN